MISTFGRHLVAEYFGCNAEVLNDLGALRRLLEEAAVAAGATVVQTVAHQFTPYGVSVVVVIEESHLSMHTWPEERYVAVDFYTCGECSSERAHEVLSRGLGAEATEVMTLHRGLRKATSIEVVEHRADNGTGLWVDEEIAATRFGLKVKNTLYTEQSEFQHIAIVETEAFGKALLLNGAWMTAEGDEATYHEMLVHPALTTAPQIKRVLIIGGADGGAAREVLNYPEIEHLDLCDIDGQLIEACKLHLPEIGPAWDDARLTVHVGDGIDFVKQHDGPKYDVILVDGCDPVGPAAGLFSEAFYKDARNILSEDGVLVTQAEDPNIFGDTHIEVVRRLRDIFGHAHPYYAGVMIYPGNTWSWTYASRKPIHKDLDELRVVRTESRTQYYNRDIHIGAFAVPNFVRRALKS